MLENYLLTTHFEVLNRVDRKMGVNSSQNMILQVTSNEWIRLDK